MRDLGRIRDNLEDLQNVKHKDSRREGVFVAKLIIGTILTLLALTLAVYLYSAVDEEGAGTAAKGSNIRRMVRN